MPIVPRKPVSSAINGRMMFWDETTKCFAFRRFVDSMILILLLNVSLSGCGSETAPGAAETAPTVLMLSQGDVAHVTRGDVAIGPAISGVITPSMVVDIKARTKGDILAVHVREGDRVRRGQSLAAMDTRELGYQVQSAEAELAAADAALKNAQNHFERTQRLVNEGAVAPRDLESAQADLNAVKAQQTLKIARLHELRKIVADAGYPSPIDGVISARKVEPGNHTDDQDVILTVVDPRMMELTASISSEDLGRIKVGLPIECRIEGYHNRTFQGTVSRINPGADPATRQVTVYVQIPNSGGDLIGGLFATGRIITERIADGLLVPSDALRTDETGQVVYRIADGQATAIPVTVGLKDESTGMIAVTGDLRENDLVLVGPTTDITSGTKVALASAGAESTAVVGDTEGGR